MTILIMIESLDAVWCRRSFAFRRSFLVLLGAAAGGGILLSRLLLVLVMLRVRFETYGIDAPQ